MADVVIEDGRATPRSLDKGPGIVFAQADVAEGAMLGISEKVASRKVLIIHNGDVVPSAAIEQHASKFEHVYCVNWMGKAANVTPIPIGLENAWRRQHGVPADFTAALPVNRHLLPGASRRHTLLIAFNSKTNPAVREVARCAGQRVHGHRDIQYRGIRSYHRHLQDSLFTLSPPGNGLDCHRTWEAIYFGSVPVVLREAWPFEHLQLPVLVVDNWEEAVYLLNDSPHDIFLSLSRRSAGPAFMVWHLHTMPLSK